MPVASEATKDATMVAPEATIGAPEAPSESRMEQISVHFEPQNGSEKLDLKLNSMTMSELRLVCKKSNIKVSK